ncbi:MAG: pyridoxal phosphate-dependent aminotransferase [Burkholderiales bacterium]|nr:pyridoxal phosphate-dependent aminotransferase [Burkholderiales bacterium]
MPDLRGPSRRAREIGQFHVMALLARAKELEAQGRSIVHMEIGEPDFPTARPIVEAGIRALEAGRTSYTAATGLPELRRAIAGFYRARYGLAVPAERIVITTGGSAALLLACAALVDPGDEVLLADPGYPCNRQFVRVMEGVPRAVPVDAAVEYQVTPGLLERHWTPRTRAVLIATPSNPTGTLVAAERLAAMAAIAGTRGGALIVDETYHGLVYEDACASAAGLPGDVFAVNSFSKYFGMTGWRLGWLVVPERHLAAVERLAQNVYLAPPTPAQYAALAAFEPGTVALLDKRRDAFRARRDYLVPALRALGFEIPVAPRGAFYVYAGCPDGVADSFAFSRELLEEAGVAVTPGADFGANAPQRHVRFAYTNCLEKLAEGVARIAAFLDTGRV